MWSFVLYDRHHSNRCHFITKVHNLEREGVKSCFSPYKTMKVCITNVFNVRMIIIVMQQRYIKRPNHIFFNHIVSFRLEMAQLWIEFQTAMKEP